MNFTDVLPPGAPCVGQAEIENELDERFSSVDNIKFDDYATFLAATMSDQHNTLLTALTCVCLLVQTFISTHLDYCTNHSPTREDAPLAIVISV